MYESREQSARPRPVPRTRHRASEDLTRSPLTAGARGAHLHNPITSTAVSQAGALLFTGWHPPPTQRKVPHMLQINVRRSLAAAAVATVVCAASTASTASTAVAGPPQQDCQTLEDELLNASPSDFPNPTDYWRFIHYVHYQLRLHRCPPPY
jgi:hypothetical protein